MLTWSMSLFIRYLLMVTPYARRWRERPFAPACLIGTSELQASWANDAWLSRKACQASSPSTLNVLINAFPMYSVSLAKLTANSYVPSARACSNLGYQDEEGPEIVRPSLLDRRDRVSSVMVTFSASGTSISTAEVRIPSLQQFFFALSLEFSESD